jgi:mutator protein MutT
MEQPVDTDTCVAAILIRDREILLCRRSPTRASYPGVWDLPGGHVRTGEALEKALARELREELGIIPERVGHLVTLALGTEHSTACLHVYRVEAWTGAAENRQPQEHSEIAWLTPDAASRLDLAHPGYVAVFRGLMPG